MGFCGRKAHLLQCAIDRFPRETAAGRSESKPDVFPDGQGVDQNALLKNHAHRSLVIGDALPVDSDIGSLERTQIDEMKRNGRFSGTRISLEPETFAFFKFETDVIVFERTTIVGGMNFDA